jgi:glycosyltransferase involved in cell wall biosynthesis
MSTPLVSICCIAYNHEDYIRDAIESFLRQETDFLIEIIIHDDASTDTTTEIIQEYEEKHPALIKPIYQEENQHQKGNIPVWEYFLFPRVKGKYIALCDADDYFTDPFKLQKQADFMERNSECSLCIHATRVLYNSNKKNDKVAHRLNGGKSTVFKGIDVISGQINGWTSSLFFRSDVAQNMPEWFKSIHYGDVALKMVCAARGDIGYIGGEPMSVYRRGTEGAWSAEEGKSRKWEERRLKNHLRLVHYFNDYTDYKFNKALSLKKSKHTINYLLAVQNYCSKAEAAQLIAKNFDAAFQKPQDYAWVCIRLVFGEKLYTYLHNKRRAYREQKSNT